MKAVIGSVLAAVGASICCIGPVALSALGAGALGAATTRFAAYRPIFVAATVVLLGTAFYTTYRGERCGPDGACRPATLRARKILLWVATVVVVLLVTFPYYVGFIL